MEENTLKKQGSTRLKRLSEEDVDLLYESSIQLHTTIFKSEENLSEILLSKENNIYPENMKKYIEKIESIKSPGNRDLVHIYMPIGRTNKSLLYTDSYIYYDNEKHKNIIFLKEGMYLIQIGGMDITRECFYYRCNHGFKFYPWTNHLKLIDKILRTRKLPHVVNFVG